jgi:hypothetical protein
LDVDSALPTCGVPLITGGADEDGAGGGAAAPGTRAVAADVADPYTFEATTVTRSVFPIWPDVGTKDDAVAPAIAAHAAPDESHAPHWNE